MATRIGFLFLALCGCLDTTADVATPSDAVDAASASPLDVATATSMPPTSDAAMAEPAALVCGNGVREGAELCDGPDCPTQCSATACIHAELLGAAVTCDARCVVNEISLCAAGDGCCPAGCDHGSDADCSPSCGDGVVTGDEKCEPGNSALPCPTSSACDDGDPCTADKVIGSAAQCSAQCAHMPITQTIGGDLCCPVGATVGMDSDCDPFCGDGVVSSNEKCDPAVPGSCPSSAFCAQLSDGCRRGVLVGAGCEARCELEEVQMPRSGDRCCPPGANAGNDSDCEPACGDGVVSSGEECDPNVPPGEYGRCSFSDDQCSLPGSDPCQKGVLIGDPWQCTARCSLGPREAGPRDACCPSGASSREDPDCEAVCGNGVLETEELCDDGPGSSRTCPTYEDCESLDRQGAGCSGRRLVGSAGQCTAQCESYEIEEAIVGDSCCPSSQSSATDPDCNDTGSMYGPCTWVPAYPPSYDPTTETVDPEASRPYGCDGTHAVCSAQWCTPLCDAGDTTDPEGRPGRCEKAFPYAFEVYCTTDADCPADRECGTTNSSTVKTCLRGLRSP